MLKDKDHRSVDFCHMLILGVAAMEMHSSDVLQGSLLPGAFDWQCQLPPPCEPEAMLSLATPLSD